MIRDEQPAGSCQYHEPRNSERATRNPQLVTRIAQPVTRNIIFQIKNSMPAEIDSQFRAPDLN